MRPVRQAPAATALCMARDVAHCLHRDERYLLRNSNGP